MVLERRGGPLRLVREGAGLNHETDEAETEEGHLETVTVTAIGTGTAIEIATETVVVLRAARGGGATAAAVQPGREEWRRRSRSQLLRRRFHSKPGSLRGGSLRSRGWRQQLEKGMMGLWVHLPPLQWSTDPRSLTTEELEPS